jgi:1,3-beta-galactosyl-N-acetylhexosamine phosphorylase
MKLEIVTKNRGAVTLPVQTGLGGKLRSVMARWGADAVRNSDGTELPPEVRELGCKIYSTVCLVRADQAFARRNMDKVHQHALMSEPVAARGRMVVIDLLRGHYPGQHEINYKDDPRKWWQVFDRTGGSILPASRWSFDRKKGTVSVRGAKPGHVYTVNFWAYQVWDPTSMFNHVLNHWKKPHSVALDPMYPEVRQKFLDYIDRWLDENPDADVVRLTSLFYHFTLFHAADGAGAWKDWRDLYRDTHGYMDCASPRAFREFQKKTGIRLALEDIVDQGFYNYPARPISKKYRAWIVFIHEFVVGLTREITARIRRRGRKAMMFLGDHWIGAEPYLPDFGKSGMDAVVGSCESGIQARHIADVPHGVIKELRLGPYFFEICFEDGEDKALAAAQQVWVRARRAIIRRPADRIGWGGYLSVPMKRPKYMAHIADVCREFREILMDSGKSLSRKTPGRVAILNYWGKMRSWSLGPMGYERFGQENFLEILAGLPFDIDFISFDDVAARGVPKDVSVIITGGRAHTSSAGRECWRDARLASAVRQFVARGGGLVGVDEPSAVEHGASYFQLADVFGVDKELGYTTEKNSPTTFDLCRDHFIVKASGAAFAPEDVESFVYPIAKDTQVLAARGSHVLMSANRYGRGRAVYIARSSFSWERTRLLHNAILWAGRNEGETKKCYSANHLIECAYYPKTRKMIAVNNSGKAQKTVLYDPRGKSRRLALRPFGSAWINLAR